MKFMLYEVIHAISPPPRIRIIMVLRSRLFFARQDLLDEFNPLSKTMLRTCLTAGYGIYVHVIILFTLIGG